jgi:hypothetical protein
VPSDLTLEKSYWDHDSLFFYFKKKYNHIHKHTHARTHNTKGMDTKKVKKYIRKAESWKELLKVTMRLYEYYPRPPGDTLTSEEAQRRINEHSVTIYHLREILRSRKDAERALAKAAKPEETKKEEDEEKQ